MTVLLFGLKVILVLIAIRVIFDVVAIIRAIRDDIRERR